MPNIFRGFMVVLILTPCMSEVYGYIVLTKVTGVWGYGFDGKQYIKNDPQV